MEIILEEFSGGKKKRFKIHKAERSVRIFL